MSRHKSGNPDLNQFKIVQALRQAGCSVQITTQVGGGCPDLVVARSGITVCLEVKNPEASKADRELRASQEQWTTKWKGKWAKVETVEEALDAMNKAVRA